MDGDVRPWKIDGGVARDLAEVLGWRGDDGPAALAALMPTAIPMGSTAKLAAITAGEVPPGADPDGLARQILGSLVPPEGGPAGSGGPGGAPVASPSWSCWVACTVMAALIDATDLGRVEVAATRRSDAGAPMVDFHAEVVVGGGDDPTWICDPYFGVAVALPEAVGERSASIVTIGSAAAGRGADGGWALEVALHAWDVELQFRRFGPALDRDDVRAMAAISATHSGVPLRPYARLHPGDRIVDVSESAEGTGRLHVWTEAGGRQEQVVSNWSVAVASFAGQTGVEVI